jgi:O-acetyl-ADP-ribose deacetylase (regulator of RNase III)
MFSFVSDDILKAKTQAIVNPVNTVGVMGKGLALQFRNTYPNNYSAYQLACNAGEVRPGRMLIFALGRIGYPNYIINFPTKRHWREKSKLEDIVSGLTALVDDALRLNIQSIAVPPLGCGLGGLPWPEVRRLMCAAFDQAPEVRWVIYGEGYF